MDNGGLVLRETDWKEANEELGHKYIQMSLNQVLMGKCVLLSVTARD